MTIDALESRSLPLSNVPALAAGEAHVWTMRLANLPVMETTMPERRVDRVRQRRMGQRFVLRLLLGAYLRVPGRDVEIVRSDAGKPMLGAPYADSGLCFNLSHAGDLFAIAIAQDVPVGIDIERRDRRVRARRLARRWFGSEEADFIDGLVDDDARAEFLRRWSAREAVIKAHGGTIAQHIADVQPSMTDPTRLEHLPIGWPPPPSWDVHEIRANHDAFGFLAAPSRLAAATGFALEL